VKSLVGAASVLDRVLRHQHTLSRSKERRLSLKHSHATLLAASVAEVAPVDGQLPSSSSDQMGSRSSQSLMSPRWSWHLGLGVPFLLVGFLVDRASPFLRRIRRSTAFFSTIGGVILILLGILLLTGLFSNYG
jgi:hypothetical protein